MLFEITRTSTYDEKPCKNSFPIEIASVDVRTLFSFEDYERRFGESFLDMGSNHRILENGHIARDMDAVKRWGLEISTLEDLMKFQEEVGEELIITTSYVDHKTPRIDIYDDYRE